MALIHGASTLAAAAAPMPEPAARAVAEIAAIEQLQAQLPALPRIEWRLADSPRKGTELADGLWWVQPEQQFEQQGEQEIGRQAGADQKPAHGGALHLRAFALAAARRRSGIVGVVTWREHA